MKIGFRQQKPGTRDYDVLRQERRGGRWENVGQVLGFGDAPGGWAALGKDADAWTTYFTTRKAATEEMLAGHTFRTRQLERDLIKQSREHDTDLEAG